MCAKVDSEGDDTFDVRGDVREREQMQSCLAKGRVLRAQRKRHGCRSQVNMRDSIAHW
jgi:hypothetical protein